MFEDSQERLNRTKAHEALRHDNQTAALSDSLCQSYIEMESRLLKLAPGSYLTAGKERYKNPDYLGEGELYDETFTSLAEFLTMYQYYHPPTPTSKT